MKYGVVANACPVHDNYAGKREGPEQGAARVSRYVPLSRGVFNQQEPVPIAYNYRYRAGALRLGLNFELHTS